MKVEDTNALRFLLQDEIYLLDEDKSLYASALKLQLEIQTQRPVFNYLGSNKKGFLILVSYDDHEFMKEEHLAALENVISRKGHSRDDVAIFNVSKHVPVSYENLIACFEPKTIVILGKAALPEGISEPKFNAIEKTAYADVLYTFSFDDMMANNDNKRVFWEQMKNL